MVLCNHNVLPLLPALPLYLASNVIVEIGKFYLYYSAICSQGCVNGECNIPDQCTCNSGWTSSSCNQGTIESVLRIKKYVCTIQTIVNLPNKICRV